MPAFTAWVFQRITNSPDTAYSYYIRVSRLFTVSYWNVGGPTEICESAPASPIPWGHIAASKAAKYALELQKANP